MIHETIWEDQKSFNALLRDLPATYEDRTALTKEFVLHLISECNELLNASGVWKMHRRDTHPENRAHIGMELIDVFKYWMSIAQIWGFSLHDLEKLYWQKSGAVRQRWAEEWIQSLDRPMVVVDLDNVLCDYVHGMCDWLEQRHPGTVSAITLNRIRRDRAWLSASTLQIPEQEWAYIKHHFRTHGGKIHLPVMPGAKDFIHWCRTQGWAVVVLTSRPVDRYPNLYTETAHWLAIHNLGADYIWWGSDKKAKLVDKNMFHKVRFAVDDDLQFVRQFEALGVRTYWMRTTNQEMTGPPITGKSVTSLYDLMKEETTWLTPTPDTAPTPNTTERLQPPPSPEAPTD